jgi:hypothetical protein
MCYLNLYSISFTSVFVFYLSLTSKRFDTDYLSHIEKFTFKYLNTISQFYTLFMMSTTDNEVYGLPGYNVIYFLENTTFQKDIVPPSSVCGFLRTILRYKAEAVFFTVTPVAA